MSNIEELKIEAEYALYQQELKAQGFREFYANSNGLSEFVLANYRLLLPGESISFDLKRVFKHNIGAWVAGPRNMETQQTYGTPKGSSQFLHNGSSRRFSVGSIYRRRLFSSAHE